MTPRQRELEKSFVKFSPVFCSAVSFCFLDTYCWRYTSKYIICTSSNGNFNGNNELVGLWQAATKSTAKAQGTVSLDRDPVEWEACIHGLHSCLEADPRRTKGRANERTTLRSVIHCPACLTACMFVQSASSLTLSLAFLDAFSRRTRTCSAGTSTETRSIA